MNDPQEQVMIHGGIHGPSDAGPVPSGRKGRPRLVHITTIPDSLAFFKGQVKFLKKKGFDVFLISSPGRIGEEIANNESVPFIPIRMKRRISLGSDIVSLFRLWKAVKRIEPDIVHSHTPKAGLLGTLASRMASVPVTFLSIFGLPQMTKGGLKKAVLDKTTKLSGALADRIWCDSHSMLEFLVSHRLCRPRKAMVIANGSVNGVDAEEAFRPEKYPPDIRELNRAKYGIPSQATVLGFVGRISKDKGIDDLLDAWRILQVKPFDLRLLLIGPREEDDPLRPDNAELLCSDENIHLLGPLSDVAAHLALIDIYVMPSHREGFGITNIEASAMELPVISTAIPGCVDSVKDGETGVLVPPRSPEALAEAIERYLSAPELAKRHGKRGRARVLSDFRPDMIWQGLLESYSELLKAKRR